MASGLGPGEGPCRLHSVAGDNKLCLSAGSQTSGNRNLAAQSPLLSPMSTKSGGNRKEGAGPVSLPESQHATAGMEDGEGATPMGSRALTIGDYDAPDHGSKHDREGERLEPQGWHVAPSRKGPVLLLQRHQQRGVS